MAPAERVAAVSRMCDHFATDIERLAASVSAETGASPTMARRSHVELPLAAIRGLGDIYLGMPSEEYMPNPRPLNDVVGPAGLNVSLHVYKPVGVVSAISAYNFPFYINLWKVASALLAGCTVVLRPSPLTPLSALAFGEAADAAGLPPGVLNVVLEAGVEGSTLMTTHPAVDLVSFTGSTAVGRQIMAQTAGTVKRLVLELGGKSVQLYLPDAVDLAPAGVAQVFTGHAGQVCSANTRLLVPVEAKADVLDRCAELAATLTVGRPTDPDTKVGPIISAAQRARCERYVADAVAAGATLVTGGRVPPSPSSGYYFEPTLLDLPDNANPVAQEEVFGPVVCAIGYRDLDDAVRIANDSIFGLAGSVYGADVGQAVAVARRIRSGTIRVNNAIGSPYASSGGQRQSGVGREKGPLGIREYQELQHLAIAPLARRG